MAKMMLQIELDEPADISTVSYISKLVSDGYEADLMPDDLHAAVLAIVEAWCTWLKMDRHGNIHSSDVDKAFRVLMTMGDRLHKPEE